MPQRHEHQLVTFKATQLGAARGQESTAGGVHPEDAETEPERYSIAFFCNPNKETLVDCLPGCSSEDNPYRYKPITAFDYITMRLSGTIDQ